MENGRQQLFNRLAKWKTVAPSQTRRRSASTRMSCSLARPLSGSHSAVPVPISLAAKRCAPPRRALRVSNCGGCTRRDLITGLVTSASSARGSRLDASEEMSLKARAAYDASFARTMETGMADYEQHMSMVKRELFRDLAGKDVLEIGMNTGPNLRYMRDARSVVGVEPNVESFPYARANAAKYGVRGLVLKRGVGERLPDVPDGSVDVVVSTLVMCTVADQSAVAKEARRVLKPGGAYVFLDHVRADEGTPLHAMQVMFDPLNRAAYEGCSLTRDPERAIRDAFGDENVDARRFVAGAADGTWLVKPLFSADAASAKKTSSFLNAIEPHFLLAPTLVGRATAA
jgi:SAM-dependent methyltransferase